MTEGKAEASVASASEDKMVASVASASEGKMVASVASAFSLPKHPLILCGVEMRS